MEVRGGGGKGDLNGLKVWVIEPGSDVFSVGIPCYLNGIIIRLSMGVMGYREGGPS